MRRSWIGRTHVGFSMFVPDAAYSGHTMEVIDGTGAPQPAEVLA